MDHDQVYMTKCVSDGVYECFDRALIFLGRMGEDEMRQFRLKRRRAEFWKAYRGGVNDQGESIVGDATFWDCVMPKVAVPHVWRTGLS